MEQQQKKKNPFMDMDLSTGESFLDSEDQEVDLSQLSISQQRHLQSQTGRASGFKQGGITGAGYSSEMNDVLASAGDILKESGNMFTENLQQPGKFKTDQRGSDSRPDAEKMSAFERASVGMKPGQLGEGPGTKGGAGDATSSTSPVGIGPVANMGMTMAISMALSTMLGIPATPLSMPMLMKLVMDSMDADVVSEDSQLTDPSMVKSEEENPQLFSPFVPPDPTNPNEDPMAYSEFSWKTEEGASVGGSGGNVGPGASPSSGEGSPGGGPAGSGSGSGGGVGEGEGSGGPI